MKNVRRGLGKGLGMGYKNLVPMDSHIHSLSAKGEKTAYFVKLQHKDNILKALDRANVGAGVDLRNWKDNIGFVTIHEKTKSKAKADGKRLLNRWSKAGKVIKVGVWEDELLAKGKKLYARSSMHTIQLDPEYSIITYSEGTRNGFRHVAILMRNGYEQEKATINYLNRTWESYEYQDVIHKLLGKAFDETKAKVLKEDIDKSSGRSIYMMAKGKKGLYAKGDDLKSELSGFTGTENYHKVSLTPVVVTDGVKYLIDKANAYWLIDAIGSYQGEKKFKDEGFQVWILKKDKEGKGATLSAYRDYSEKDPKKFKPLVTQKIEYTDFPIDEIKLYEIDGVVLLPSEY